PKCFRLGITRTWDSLWYARKDYAKMLHEDLQIRSFLQDKLKFGGISKILIERAAEKVKVTIFTARPGIVIGKKGSEIEKLSLDLRGLVGKEVNINIHEVKNPEFSAVLVGEGIARQLEKRIGFRKAMKKSIALAMKSKVKGIKISCSGRLGGAEIARTEWYMEGRVPLHTLRADVDFAIVEAMTVYGKIGVKVWIFKGEIFKDKINENFISKTGKPETKSNESKKSNHSEAVTK
ncbi:30S ribosomal protein S3, partial [Candidatus Desantisbacteria bacterium]|nr:30S ribosomal protein S3 [Candidatus Desantisbacteria bacterium]